MTLRGFSILLMLIGFIGVGCHSSDDDKSKPSAVTPPTEGEEAPPTDTTEEEESIIESPPAYIPAERSRLVMILPQDVSDPAARAMEHGLATMLGQSFVAPTLPLTRNYFFNDRYAVSVVRPESVTTFLSESEETGVTSSFLGFLCMDLKGCLEVEKTNKLILSLTQTFPHRTLNASNERLVTLATNPLIQAKGFYELIQQKQLQRFIILYQADETTIQQVSTIMLASQIKTMLPPSIEDSDGNTTPQPSSQVIGLFPFYPQGVQSSGQEAKLIASIGQLEVPPDAILYLGGTTEFATWFAQVQAQILQAQWVTEADVVTNNLDALVTNTVFHTLQLPQGTRPSEDDRAEYDIGQDAGRFVKALFSKATDSQANSSEEFLDLAKEIQVTGVLGSHGMGDYRKTLFHTYSMGDNRVWTKTTDLEVQELTHWVPSSLTFEAPNLDPDEPTGTSIETYYVALLLPLSGDDFDVRDHAFRIRNGVELAWQQAGLNLAPIGVEYTLTEEAIASLEAVKEQILSDLVGTCQGQTTPETIFTHVVAQLALQKNKVYSALHDFEFEFMNNIGNCQQVRTVLPHLFQAMAIKTIDSSSPHWSLTDSNLNALKSVIDSDMVTSLQALKNQVFPAHQDLSEAILANLKSFDQSEVFAVLDTVLNTATELSVSESVVQLLIIDTENSKEKLKEIYFGRNPKTTEANTPTLEPTNESSENLGLYQREEVLATIVFTTDDTKTLATPKGTDDKLILSIAGSSSAFQNTPHVMTMKPSNTAQGKALQQELVYWAELNSQMTPFVSVFEYGGNSTYSYELFTSFLKDSAETETALLENYSQTNTVDFKPLNQASFALFQGESALDITTELLAPFAPLSPISTLLYLGNSESFTVFNDRLAQLGVVVKAFRAGDAVFGDWVLVSEDIGEHFQTLRLGGRLDTSSDADYQSRVQAYETAYSTLVKARYPNNNFLYYEFPWSYADYGFDAGNYLVKVLSAAKVLQGQKVDSQTVLQTAQTVIEEGLTGKKGFGIPDQERGWFDIMTVRPFQFLNAESQRVQYNDWVKVRTTHEDPIQDFTPSPYAGFWQAVADPNYYLVIYSDYAVYEFTLTGDTCDGYFSGRLAGDEVKIRYNDGTIRNSIYSLNGNQLIEKYTYQNPHHPENDQNLTIAYLFEDLPLACFTLLDSLRNPSRMANRQARSAKIEVPVQWKYRQDLVDHVPLNRWEL